MPTVAFASYGVLLCILDGFEGAHRYATLEFRLLKRCEDTRLQLLPRVYFTVFGIVNPWKKPLTSSFEHLPWVISTAVETGDFEGAMFSSYTFILHSYAAGDNLMVVKERLEEYLFILQRCQQGPWLAMTVLLRQVMDNFIGKSDDPLLLTMKMSAQANNNNDFLLYETTAINSKLQLAYHFGDWKEALACAKASRVVEKVIKGAFYATYQYFYDAMTVLEMAHYGRRRLGRAQTVLRRFEKLAQVNPENFAHKLFLLRGEQEALKGKLDVALEWFEKAMEEAGKQGVTPLRALAYERSAVVVQRLGSGGVDDKTRERQLLTRAVELYDQWGAASLSTYLKAKHHLR